MWKVTGPKNSKLLGRIPVGAVSIVVVVLLAAETVALIPRAHSVPLEVSATLLESGPTYSSARFSLETRYGNLMTHLALLPGIRDRTVNCLIVYKDPTVPLRYASQSDLEGLVSRISQFLQDFGSNIPVITTNATELSGVLEHNPHGTLLDFGYGSLPSSVISRNTTLLVSWIMGGGTLIWAGGPLGYFESTPSANDGVTFSSSLGWEGQIEIAGFPLEDPIGDPAKASAGPLLGMHPSVLAKALGMMYQGTIDGANTSQLLAAGGFDIGWDSSPGSGQSIRTSIASIPRGLGYIFYFGGALWGDGSGVVPGADVELSGDIALLLSTGYLPGQGFATSLNILVTPTGGQSFTLAVFGNDPHLIALVTSKFGDIYTIIWVRELT